MEATNITKQKALSMTGINKSFGSSHVLKNVSLNLYKGSVMALMGENGAGKSTLMKILSGIIYPESGNIELFAKSYVPQNPLKCEEDGIVIIHQELNLFEDMTVLDNIFIASEKKKNALEIDYKEEIKVVYELFSRLDINISPKTYVRDLSVGEKQLVEIVKALRKNASILIMDEPTSALSLEEIENIFAVIKILKESGVSVVYISHRMQEIYSICDYITILRDGEFVGEWEIKDIPEEKLINAMVGRDITEPFPYVKSEKVTSCMEVKNLSNAFVRDVSFSLNYGEILGIGGLMGSGRTTLAHVLYGLQNSKSGEVFIDGKKVNIKHPNDALRNNIVYISEDRKIDGLFTDFSIMFNTTISSIKKFQNNLFTIKAREEIAETKKYMKTTNVKAESFSSLVSSLSGGNQQKVAIARALMINPSILILDEPTRGIDIGARREIYTLINELKIQGSAIILISSDMPELLALSDRVMVMSEGKMTGVLNFKEKTPENVMKLAIPK